jgi:hypothetical protein
VQAARHGLIRRQWRRCPASGRFATAVSGLEPRTSIVAKSWFSRVMNPGPIADAALEALRRAPYSTLDKATRAELGPAVANVISLARRRETIPRRIPVGQRSAGAVIKLATESKHLTNVLKMIAYQAESDLVRAVAPHYHRADDEGRTLVQNALASAADIHVDAAELRVTLAPLGSPHRSRAVAALCKELDAAGVPFPGTRLRLRCAVADAR